MNKDYPPSAWFLAGAAIVGILWALCYQPAAKAQAASPRYSFMSGLNGAILYRCDSLEGQVDFCFPSQDQHPTWSPVIEMPLEQRVKRLNLEPVKSP